MMKIARIQMTSEIKGWDRMLAKYYPKLKTDGALTHAAKTLIERSARLLQETINNNLSPILTALA